MGSDSSNNGREAGNLEVIHYDGNEVKRYPVSKVFEFEYSIEFEGNLYVFSTDGLYKSPDAINFEPVEFFENYGCAGDKKRFLSDMAVLNGKMYVSVINGIQEGYNWHEDKDWLDEIIGIIFGDDCEPFHKSSIKERVNNYIIYSSEDGVNWTEVFTHRSGIERVESNAKFPLVVFNDKIYAGVSDPSEDRSLITGESKFYRSSFAKNSSFISKPHEIGNFSSGTLSWEIENSENSNVRFQIRTSANSDFVGLNNSKDSYFTIQDSIFYPNNIGDTWVQYKVDIEVNDEMKAPFVKEVTLKRNDIDSSLVQVCINKYY